MNYSLFKLKFLTAVHFGSSDTALSLYTSEDHFLADTLFSALCHAAFTLGGEKHVERLCSQVMQGELLLSDGMPWQEDDCFLPRPMMIGKQRQEVPAAMRKAMKKRRWIPVKAFSQFTQALQEGTTFDVNACPESFGQMDESTKIVTPDEAERTPYQVGLFRFAPNAGLYLIAGYTSTQQEEELSRLLQALGLGGIGGKTSSGYGRFELEDQIYLNEPFDEQTEWLYRMLTFDTAPHQMLLTTSLPHEDELEDVLQGATYQLIRRGGFVRPDETVVSAQKKRTQYFFQAGSVVEKRFKGVLYRVGETSRHPVYRYSKPLCLGVNV